MRRNETIGLLVVGIALCCLGAGCTISIQPWTKPVAVAPPAPPFPVDPTGGFQGPMPKALPPGVGNDTMVQLIKEYRDAEDHRKALVEQVQSLRKQLKDRDSNLQLALHEVEESTKQLKRTRDDMRNWQAEMDDLRDRIRKLEESRASLKPLIEEILHHLERNKEPAKLQGHK